MPHVDIKYKDSVISGDQLAPTMQRVTEIVGSYFEVEPAYVSLELVPQGPHALNRKDIDLEINAAPGGHRIENADALAAALRDHLVAVLEEAGIAGEVSAYVRVFSCAPYEYGVTP